MGRLSNGVLDIRSCDSFGGVLAGSAKDLAFPSGKVGAGSAMTEIAWLDLELLVFRCCLIPRPSVSKGLCGPWFHFRWSSSTSFIYRWIIEQDMRVGLLRSSFRGSFLTLRLPPLSNSSSALSMPPSMA